MGRQAVVRKGAAVVSKNAGKQKQAVVKMEIGAGGGQVVTDAGGKKVPQDAVDSRLWERVTTLTSRPGWPDLGALHVR